MRILFLCAHQVWPADTGARLRNFHLANALAKRCAVTLAQLRAPGEDIKASHAFRDFERVLTFERDRSYTAAKILKGVLGPSPLPVLNYFSPQVAESLSQLLVKESFDAVQFENVHVLPYTAAVKRVTRPPAIVVDWHNIESELMRRYAATQANWAKKLVAKRTAALLETAETELLKASRIHTVPSAREREVLLARGCENEIHVLPNGVDVSRFSQVNRADCGPASNTLLFVGSMDYHANIDGVTWFLRQVWPLMYAESPDLIFTIVGRSPGPEIQKLASESVRVTGTVADVLPFYERALAVIVPLRVGGGTRLKILEAMAAGVPVISTRLGAEGLDVENDSNVVLADSPAEMIAALRRLRNDSGFWRHLTENARRLVSQKYDWDSLGEKLYRIHETQTTVVNT